MLYNIYAGRFGGCQYQYTEDFQDEQEAMDAAHDAAVEDYQMYEGMGGISSWSDIKEEYCEANGIFENELTEEDNREIDCIYDDEMESWLSFAVTTVEEDPDHDRF